MKKRRLKMSFGKPRPRRLPDPGRRAIVLFGAQAALIGVLAWRMRQLQVVEAAEYLTLAEDNRINVQIIPPARGRIFDRGGEPLAANRQNYRVVMVRERAESPATTLDRLGQLIDLPRPARDRVLKEMRKKSAFVPVIVKEFMDWRDFALVNANAPALPGVTPEVGLTRYYPEGEALAHVVGYVSAVTEEEIAEDRTDDPLLQLPDFRIGKNGIERVAEAALRGSAGARRIEVNSVGRVIRELDRDDGEAGADVTLTVDLALQRYAMRRVLGDSVSATVIEVATGDVVAMASAPSFDANSFVFGISSAEWKALIGDRMRPLTNKPISDLYPPGSTFKMVVALAAQSLAGVSPQETVFCSGRYRLGNQIFHCWKRGGHGRLNMREAIKQSCDIFFYDTARRTGIEAIARTATEFGLGQTGTLEIPNVKPGLVPTPAWKRAVHSDDWREGDTVNIGIGQGFLLTTPFQLAVMAARLASGRATEPRLIRAIGGADRPPKPAPDLPYRPEHFAVVRDGMNAVMNERGGTAWRARIADPAMAMAGKTGTAQVKRITMAQRAAGMPGKDDTPWAERDHALFVAYAPVDRPKYAVSVVVQHGGGGSKVAAPIARDIMMFALYGREGPLEAYPAELRGQIEEERLERARQAAAEPSRRA